MSAFTLAPLPYQSVFDTNGNPVSGALISTYLSGTSTLSTTYADAAGTTPNANPIIADSAGRFVVYLPAGLAQKWIFKTAASVVIRTIDPVSSVPSSASNQDVTGTAGEALSAGQVVYLSDGSGSKTAGQWFKADATNTYSSTTPIVGMVPDAIASAASGTIRLGGTVTGLSGLTVGTSYYVSGTAGSTTATAPQNSRFLGVATGTDTLVITPNPPNTLNVSPLRMAVFI